MFLLIFFAMHATIISPKYLDILTPYHMSPKHAVSLACCVKMSTGDILKYFPNFSQKTILDIYHSLGKFTDDKLMIFFFIFLRKQDLSCHASCLYLRQFA